MAFASTEKLYYENCYETRFVASVLSCTENKNGFEIILDKTYFYPEGGGQPSDTGKISGAEVLGVRESGGVIIHTTDKPPEAGATVECEINWPRRFTLMQHHTGEHILSGTLWGLFGVSNIGFHMGADYTTIDTSREMSANELEAAEKAANLAIYQNAAVNADYPEPKVLAKMDYRSKKELEGPVRIVTVEGHDACACCGLHCRSAGEVGVIKIINSHKYKSGTRIYMLCGEKALEDYSNKNKNIYAISALLSVKPDETSRAAEALLAENAVLKEKISEYKNEIYMRVANETPTGEKLRVVFMDGLSADDLRRLALLIGERAQAAAVFSGGGAGGFKYTLCSKNNDMREYAALLNAAFNGRGGGQAALIQGAISGSEIEIKAFVEKSF